MPPLSASDGIRIRLLSVYVFYTGGTIGTDVHYQIVHAGGTTQTIINQQRMDIPGNGWEPIILRLEMLDV